MPNQDHLLEKIVSGVLENGVYVAEEVLSPKQCAHYRKLLEAVLSNCIKEKNYFGNHTYQVIYHYFSHDFKLIDLVDHSLVQRVMNQLIDEDFVLISPSARNRRDQTLETEGKSTSGIGWHNDARYSADGQTAFKPSLNYYAVIMLDEFNVENGATQIIPGSHKLYYRPRNRSLEDSAFGPNSISHMVGPIGSIAFFDAALWHAVGKTNDTSRWGVFNMYGPWFMKPYYDFGYMFTEKQFKAMTPLQRQVLHYDSRPSPNAASGRATLRRVQNSMVHR